MKFILCLLLISLPILPSFAGDELMEKVCLYTRGCERFSTKSSSSSAMLSEYARFVEGDELGTQRTLKLAQGLKGLPVPGGTVWGELERGKAHRFILSHDSQIEGSLEVEVLNRIVSLLARNASLKYGFSPHTGGSLCGVGFPGLIIIDENNQAIYDLSLFGWPSC